MKLRLAWRRLLFHSLPVVLLALVQPATALAAGDEFDSRLQHLKSANTAVVGRDAIIKDGEKLIADYPDDPRTAEAMFHIATLLENQNPNIGMYADRSAALVWYRKAVERAAPGTPIWSRSRKYLAGRIYFTGPAGKAEAKTLRAAILEANPGDWRTQFEMEQELFSTALNERNPAEGEMHYRRMVELLQNTDKRPADTIPQRSIDFMIVNGGKSIVSSWVSALVPKEERIRRIRAFAASHPDVPGLAAAAAQAEKDVGARVEVPMAGGQVAGAPREQPAAARAGQTPVAPAAPVIADPRERAIAEAQAAAEASDAGLSWVVIAVNVLAIVGLIAMLVIRRRKKV